MSARRRRTPPVRGRGGTRRKRWQIGGKRHLRGHIHRQVAGSAGMFTFACGTGRSGIGGMLGPLAPGSPGIESGRPGIAGAAGAAGAAAAGDVSPGSEREPGIAGLGCRAAVSAAGVLSPGIDGVSRRGRGGCCRRRQPGNGRERRSGPRRCRCGGCGHSREADAGSGGGAGWLSAQGGREVLQNLRRVGRRSDQLLRNVRHGVPVPASGSAWAIPPVSSAADEPTTTAVARK